MEDIGQVSFRLRVELTTLLYLMTCLMSPHALIYLAESRENSCRKSVPSLYCQLNGVWSAAGHAPERPCRPPYRESNRRPVGHRSFYQLVSQGHGRRPFPSAI